MALQPSCGQTLLARFLSFLAFLLDASEGGPETVLGSLKVTQQLEDKKSKLSKFKDELDQGPESLLPLSFLPVTQEKCI